MRKTFIALIVAVLMAVSVFPGRSFAGANSIDKDLAGVEQRSVSKEPSEEPKKAAETRRSAEEAKKNIVARVNGAEIDMFILTRTMNRVASKYVREGDAVTTEITGAIKMEALNRLIFEELAVQEAVRQDINPASEAIEKVVAQVRENAGSAEAYREYLEKAFLTEDTLKKLIERSQRYELITAREIYGKVTVDEKLLRDQYEKEKGSYILPENLVVDDVWFMKAKDDSQRKKAEEVLNTIKRRGNDFGKLVLDGTFIVRKLKVKQEKYPEIHKVMAGMKVGDLSGVISDKDGFHIIKVTKKEPLRQATFDEARGAIEPKFLVLAQDQRKEEWGRELRKNAKIEIMLDDINNDHAGEYEMERK